MGELLLPCRRSYLDIYSKIHGLWIVRNLIYIPNLRPGIELREDVVVRIINPEVSLPLLDDCPQCPESGGLVINSK